MRVLVFTLIILLGGCMGGGYKKFYNSYVTENRYVKSKRNPVVRNVQSHEHEAMNETLDGRGFVCIGESSFSSGIAPSERSARSLAKKLGAEYVVLSRSYQKTASGVYSMTTPTQQTTYHSGNVNVYGYDGSFNTGTYYGSSTTYGTETTNIPYSIDRYNYRASFFARTGESQAYIHMKKKLEEKWDRDEISQAEVEKQLKAFKLYEQRKRNSKAGKELEQKLDQELNKQR